MEEKLRTYLQKIAEKENYKQSKIGIKLISSEGANYTTVLYLATITEPLKPDLNLFAKVANSSEKVRKRSKIMSNMYLIESIFYTELSDNFERIYNKNNVPIEERILKPKCYGHVLTPLEEIMSLNWDYASPAVSQLAKFHAIGLAFRHESPLAFEEISDKIKMHVLDIVQTDAFLRQAVHNAVYVVNDDYRSRLQNYLNVEQMKELMSRFIERDTMLVHGDFRPSNLMHRRQDGKLDIVTLDYQTVRVGNPVADLMYFIISASDEEFRGLHYRRLLEHYFTQLTLALRQLGVDVENVYPRKTFDLDVIEFQPLGLLFSLALLPLFLVDPEDAPDMESNVSPLTVKPNKRALERINGVVNDFAKWGII